jgi:choline dehydrogenase-like flavoprotein
VILCGGSINSPQLLQVSGVGDAEHLRSVGVDVVHHLPGVGENLQDHLEVYVQYGSKKPVSVAPALKYKNRPVVGAKWLFGRTGPGATNHFEGGGFVRGNDEVAYPNLMFHFLPLAIRYDGTAGAPGHGRGGGVLHAGRRLHGKIHHRTCPSGGERFDRHGSPDRSRRTRRDWQPSPSFVLSSS